MPTGCCLDLELEPEVVLGHLYTRAVVELGLVDCRVLFGHGRLPLVVPFGAVVFGSEVGVVGELHRVGQ